MRLPPLRRHRRGRRSRCARRGAFPTRHLRGATWRRCETERASASGNGGRRSAEWFDRRDLDGFLHRSWLKSSGVTDETFRGKPRDRHLQQLERARQLQRPPARAGRVGQARRAAGRRLPARVPGHVARRVADEADDDALPQPDGDGRRGVDPRLPARRRRPAHRLRQDEPGQHHGRGEREHPDDRRHRRADAQRPLARPRARLVLATAGTTTRSSAPAGSPRTSSSRSRTRCRARTATA